ncbi:MAG: DUF1015 family protein [Paraprevotella sp.]|nr:DUF1015 family protein [Paraprevotella sp.]
MALVKPFQGLRPPKEWVEKVECRPYDVLNSEEARREAGDNEMSLYHVIHPEIDFPEGTDEYAPCVYEKGAENFAKFQRNGWLIQDAKPMYYIYSQTMNGRTQNGIVLAASVDDYLNGVIKRHELTRHDKEEDRMKLIRVTDANIEPVFLSFPDNPTLANLVRNFVIQPPGYDFIDHIDGFRHRFWLVDQDDDIHLITQEFAKMPALYIADGHHRTAAAVHVGQEKSLAHGGKNPEAEYNYVMAVCFPAGELTILDYNRVVRDLGEYSASDFLEALKSNFEVTCMGEKEYKPERIHEFALYFHVNWYRLRVLAGRFNGNDPVDSLDVSISSRLILDELLGIKDLRRDHRIDFVGGLRGLSELKRRCDCGEMRMALALYPVSMQQIMDIADRGEIMPPKATWFEPKLRSGLVIHKLS